MHGLDTKTSGIPCATPYSHRPVQKLLARIGNPRSSQQLMGQLPHFCGLKAKKFNDFSRACVSAYVQDPEPRRPIRHDTPGLQRLLSVTYTR